MNTSNDMVDFFFWFSLICSLWSCGVVCNTVTIRYKHHELLATYKTELRAGQMMHRGLNSFNLSLR